MLHDAKFSHTVNDVVDNNDDDAPSSCIIEVGAVTVCSPTLFSSVDYFVVDGEIALNIYLFICY